MVATIGSHDSEKRPPGPRGVPWFGSAFDAWRDPLEFLVQSVRAYGNVVAFRFGHLRYLLVNEPEGVKHVLVDNAKNYTKSRNYDGLKLLLGQGLLTSEGDFWKKQRRLTQPAFHREHLAGFVETMARSTEALIDRWSTHEGAAPLDMHVEMMGLTFHIVGLALLSVDLLGDARAIGSALTSAITFVDDYAESLVRLPPWVPTPANLRFRKAQRALDALVLRVIDERRKSGAPQPDLLGMLMAVKDEETGAGMSDRQLRDEVMTLVLAGHETTANALTWAFYLLSKHPDAARRVHAEAASVLGERSPDVSDVAKLTYTRAVVDEALRLYPPAWAFERQAIEADDVLGYSVRPGTLIGICPYALHRDPRHWDNPEGFDPSRFLAASDRPKFSYLPFGGGPRVCIGAAFAVTEAVLVLAMVMRRYRVDLLPGERAEMAPVVTLRPRHGVWMQIRPWN